MLGWRGVLVENDTKGGNGSCMAHPLLAFRTGQGDRLSRGRVYMIARRAKTGLVAVIGEVKECATILG
jgi:hypothetical protein